MPSNIKRSIFLSAFIFSLVCFSFNSCKQEKEIQGAFELIESVKEGKFEKAAVVSAHPLASEIGKEILMKGGNAIDAAIAVQFALAVCYPAAGNIGGGGFMILRTKDGIYEALDFRETAPASAHRDMYLNEEGEVIQGLSLNGALAAGIPGSVDGMWEAFQKYSKLKQWTTLVEPSVELARRGYEISAQEAGWLNRFKESFLEVNKDTIILVNAQSEWKEGDLLIQEDLARTLSLIAEKGRDGFYTGEVAEQIVAEMDRSGGIITLDDLRNYRSVWREVIKSEYKDYTVVGMPPPSSGGIALAMLLNAMESQELDSLEFHSPEAIHLMAEAERRVYADRAIHFGDSDFYDVPVEQLLSKEYMKDRMEDFDPVKASLTSDIQAGNMKESEETTHFSILDEEGNAVSLTTTINTGYGSKLMVSGAGFLLNNEMDDFSAKPGVPNFFGLVGTEANAIEANKRMLSSMTPTIVEKDGELRIIVGTPGGSTIITSVFQVLMNIIEFDMNAYEATSACRFHHQWKPDNIFIEEQCFSDSLKTLMNNLGHEVVTRSGIGKVETIMINDEGLVEAAADPRGDDSASGY